MESVGTLSEGEWNSFSGMFSTEEADFMSQLLGSYSFASEQDQGPSLVHPSAFWSCHEPTTNLAMVDENSYYCSDNVNFTSQYFSHGGGYSSDTSLFLQTPGNENYYLNNSIPVLMTNNNSSVSMDYCMVDEQNTGLSTKVFLDNVMEDASCLNEDISNDSLRESSGTQSEPVFLHDQNFQPKRKCEISELDTVTDDKSNVNSSESPKKKSRVSGDIQKKKRNVQSKRNQKGVAISNDEEEKQSSSSSSSEDSNVLQEPNGGEDSSPKASALNLNGKTRASRGSATDPQSLYARKRRERINERLRILQNLVPNGTKVDISTMLEEAVDYVKFLQLQIKLLSSDDLWMYAPIAYNGMNIGLDLKASPSQQQLP